MQDLDVVLASRKDTGLMKSVYWGLNWNTYNIKTLNS